MWNGLWLPAQGRERRTCACGCEKAFATLPAGGRKRICVDVECFAAAPTEERRHVCVCGRRSQLPPRGYKRKNVCKYVEDIRGSPRQGREGKHASVRM